MDVNTVTRQSQSLPPEIKTVDIEALLYGTLLKWKPEWEEKNIDLVGIFAAEAFAQADGTQVSQIFDWILSHAIGRTDCGGEVFVGLETDHEWVRVSVADNSCGLSPKELEKVRQWAEILSCGGNDQYRNSITMQLPRAER